LLGCFLVNCKAVSRLAQTAQSTNLMKQLEREKRKGREVNFLIKTGFLL